MQLFVILPKLLVFVGTDIEKTDLVSAETKNSRRWFLCSFVQCLGNEQQ